LGYEHRWASHREGFVNHETSEYTNIIESLWGASKDTFGLSSRRRLYFNGYLAKYMFYKVFIESADRI
jgi:hypothetical protein